jgi:2'-5' RNA ligase
MGCFGQPPKILFLKILDTNDRGKEIVSLIEKANNLESNYPKWILHLTLARFRTGRESRTLKKHLLEKTIDILFSPTKITLFTSKLTSSGPIYRDIEYLSK